MKIKLSEWAGRLYSPAPSAWLLRKWCRDGEIHPQPERVGRDWYVEETARRLTCPLPVGGGLVAQLQNRRA